MFKKPKFMNYRGFVYKYYLLAVHGTLSKVTHEKYELPTTFSEEAQDLVNSTLKKTAELRPNIKG